MPAWARSAHGHRTGWRRMLRVWAHLIGGGALLLPYVILASFALPFGIGGAAWGWQVAALLAIVPVILLTVRCSRSGVSASSRPGSCWALPSTCLTP